MLKCIGKFEIWVMEGNAFLPLPDEKNNRLFVNEEDFRKMLAACNNDHDNKQTNRILGTGRKPIREKQYGKVVRELRNHISVPAACLGSVTTGTRRWGIPL